MIDEFLGGGENAGYDLQVCKGPKSWLIYITKEDRHPYVYNVPRTGITKKKLKGPGPGPGPLEKNYRDRDRNQEHTRLTVTTNGTTKKSHRDWTGTGTGPGPGPKKLGPAHVYS